MAAENGREESIMLGIENGYAIGKDISNVERFRKRGVVYMTLCTMGIMTFAARHVIMPKDWESVLSEKT